MTSPWKGTHLIPDEKRDVDNLHVAPSYCEVLGIPLVAGREIGLQDVGNSVTVAMVNEAFVRHISPAKIRLDIVSGLAVRRTPVTSKLSAS